MAAVTLGQNSAFLEVPITIAGYQLRPLSANSLLLLQRTKNKLLNAGVEESLAGESEANFDLADTETLFALLAFIYLHAAPLPEVLKSVRLPPEGFEDVVYTFADKIPVADLMDVGKAIGAEVGTATAAAVEAESPAEDPSHAPQDPNS